MMKCNCCKELCESCAVCRGDSVEDLSVRIDELEAEASKDSDALKQLQVLLAEQEASMHRLDTQIAALEAEVATLKLERDGAVDDAEAAEVARPLASEMQELQAQLAAQPSCEDVSKIVSAAILSLDQFSDGPSSALEAAREAIRAAFADKAKCPNCKGTGRYVDASYTTVNPMEVQCKDCLGTGKVQITEENKS